MMKVFAILAASATVASAANASHVVDDSAFLTPDVNPINEIFMRMDATKLKHTKAGATIVKSSGAQWMRVAFDKSSVSADAEFKLEIKSTYDGHVQRLNATTLAQWQVRRSRAAPVPPPPSPAHPNLNCAQQTVRVRVLQRRRGRGHLHG